ncbi:MULTISPECIES: jacalin-like lectin [Moorena]|uniref:Jacalin-like lectin domain protein n=1 Tax=Moorena producens 3L TaxID=489825 RepID=F4XX72_9CYAN|nr:MULTISPECIES: jacalin-like lectin [Moorena]NEQ12396.1 hypothetical protein [Moorena sp. SIO3E2]EGJ30957.1 Jacalin-like lectin domain protein [Moorena producens 3L]NEP30181.1 hypothetical protein [Moorena sp. SIO3B2]NEP64909.1 hypothetical protein [Moorena sp. SIO3A5]NEQ07373.1 hypothetical protein [Moorena sp. SIO4E2]
MFKRFFQLIGLLAAVVLLSTTLGVSPAQAQVIDGPVGRTTTEFYNFPEARTLGPITEITVHHGFIIDGFKVSYANGKSFQNGGTGGGETTISFSADDPLVEVDGYVADYSYAGNKPLIAQLTFKTLKGKSYGPFGTMQATSNRKPFTLKAAQPTIQSFFGSASGYLTSLGVYIDTGCE